MQGFACATAADCDHIGLLVGERFALGDFGAMGYLIRNSATVGDALRELLLHLYRYDRVAVPVVMRPEASIALLAYSIHHHDVPRTRQVLDVAVTIGYRVMRELCGEAWKPLLVQFSYGRPKNVAAYRRLFGAAVRFDAEVSGLAFPASWLRHPIAGADPALLALVTRALQGAEADDPMRFPEEVQCVLHQLLLSGVASADNVARFFGISERTLRQRLRAEGAGFQPLLDQTRHELAQQLLQNTELPMSEIAATLQYADPSVFSRAFRKWAGQTPSRWRATRRKAAVDIRSHRSHRALYSGLPGPRASPGSASSSPVAPPPGDIMKHRIPSCSALLLMAAAALACASLPASAEDRGALVADARRAYNNLVAKFPAAKALGKDAVAVLVFPKITKAGWWSTKGWASRPRRSP